MLKLQELRSSMGLTQRELAEKIGVKNYTIANWEQNRTQPGIRDLIDLANFFECSIDYLVGRENDLGQILIFKDGDKENAELLSFYRELTPERKTLARSLLQELKKLTIKERE